MDTIYAMASAQGRAGVSVIRVSGSEAWTAGSSLAGDLPDPRQTAIRVLRDKHGVVLDEALVVCFTSPHSFTGEDVVEFHVHGSTSVVRAVLMELGQQPGLRLADPGEFTRRALENSRLDLAQVEGLADLIDAETEAQRKQAVRVFSGELGSKVEVWRRRLIRAAALLEATIDFADEEVPQDVTPEVIELLTTVRSDLEEQSAGTRVAERIRTGFEVALVGPPNAGKSTLLNRLAGRDAAITSDIAGTTRDVIEVRMDLDGLPVVFLDTAGLRKSEDEVETIGVARAIERAKAADLRVFLTISGEPLLLTPTDEDIVLAAKVDLLQECAPGISGKTGAGVTELTDRIQAFFADQAEAASLATRERHRIAIERASLALTTTLQIVSDGPYQYDIAAEELRSAIRALESLVGRLDVESLLDEIFSSFCLGK